MTSRQLEYNYDIFISYSPNDRGWVDEWLLPRLEQAGLRVCIDYRDFKIGWSHVLNEEWAVDSSRHTIVVLSPAWVNNQWNEFESLLVSTTDPSGRQQKLIPILYKKCILPQRIAALTHADFTKPAQREAQLRLLINSLIASRNSIQLSSNQQPSLPKAQAQPTTILNKSVVSILVVATIIVGLFFYSGLLGNKGSSPSSAHSRVALRATSVSATTAAIVVTNAQSETILFDTFDRGDDEIIGPVTSTISLEKAKLYRITITGTWSAWGAGWWASVCKGTPEPEPYMPSQDVVNGNVGLDAAYIFARPSGSIYCGQKENLPSDTSSIFPFLISLDNGASWQPLIPDDSNYNPEHNYIYTITANGFPASFQLKDLRLSTDDNYGVLVIQIDGPLK